ncbi:MAG: MBL fold metallo-hydrolase [Clostridia bacterium]|nr:MBL fold metallo-hydrolase [Clostridia bacterium]
MTIVVLSLGDLETNCYVVWDDPDRALVIDPADDPDSILTVIRSKGLTVQAVLLTHVHFDHMLAAEAVCQATGAPLWAGAGDEPALGDPGRNLSTWLPGGQAVTLTADRLLREGDRLSMGGQTLTVWETPGHTPGCICLVGDGVLFSGDTLFCGSIGRIDFPGGDVTAMRASLSRLCALPDETAVYSGHGPATTIGREKMSNPYLR